MQPAQLTSVSFSGYPPQARALAVSELALLRDLPLVLVPLLLRELIAYDWKLPAERRALDRQLRYLNELPDADRTQALAGFRALPIGPEISGVDWVNTPSNFIDKLTAWLWSTHRIESFRALADTYAAAVDQAFPEPPPTMPRLGVVVLGQGVALTTLPLFRKLRPSGVHLTNVRPDDGFAMLAKAISQRASGSTQSTSALQPDFLHWLIEGGPATPTPHLTQVSYEALDQPRNRLLSLIRRAVDSGNIGPEELRSLLERTQPEEIGLGETGGPAGASGPSSRGPLNHFQLSLLTEGAGAQIFSTTFVQWAARECIRRAQPESLLVRYAPRQQAQTMNRMLSGAPPLGTDPAGSLLDADMGAYYTWLNLRRLTGADQLRFLVWFEGHAEALAIGPGLPHGTTSDSPMNLDQVLHLLA